jgi:hypothetical protein
LYREFAGEGGDMLSSLVVKLADPNPYDLTEVDLTEYKGIVAPWNDWRAVEAQCRLLALGLLDQPSSWTSPRPAAATQPAVTGLASCRLGSFQPGRGK